MAWFAVLLWTGNSWLFLTGTIVELSPFQSGYAVSGKKSSKRKTRARSSSTKSRRFQPASSAGSAILLFVKTDRCQHQNSFAQKQNWLATLGVFAAFRFFDVLKPWPIRQSQSLPGGWGVTVDDALAAVYVNAVVLAVFGGRLVLGK